jgi:AraC-like DNA-binding protein
VCPQQSERSAGVAYRLCFSNTSAFHKTLRRWTGISPADYANQAQEGLAKG